MRKKRVLIVEDENDIAEFTRRSIQSDDIDVFTTFDGLSALNEIPRFKPDLILLDVMLPTLDGFEVCKRLKDNPDTENILIILFSAASEPFIIERVVGVGADDYLMKPVSSRRLNEKIRSTLGLTDAPEMR